MNPVKAQRKQQNLEAGSQDEGGAAEGLACVPPARGLRASPCG
jgi:hypothetical protein